MEPWSCVLCGRRFHEPPDLFKGNCFPSWIWALHMGLDIKAGKWLPIAPPAPKVAKVTTRRKRVKTPGLFDTPAVREFEPAEDPEIQGLDSFDDWSA